MIRPNFYPSFVQQSQLYNMGQPVYKPSVIGQSQSYVPQRPIYAYPQPQFHSYQPALNNIATIAAKPVAKPIAASNPQGIQKFIVNGKDEFDQKFAGIASIAKNPKQNQKIVIEIKSVYSATKDSFIFEIPGAKQEKPSSAKNSERSYSTSSDTVELRIKTKANLHTFPSQHETGMTLADRRHRSKGYRSHIDTSKQTAVKQLATQQVAAKEPGQGIINPADKLKMMELEIERLRASRLERTKLYTELTKPAEVQRKPEEIVPPQAKPINEPQPAQEAVRKPVAIPANSQPLLAKPAPNLPIVNQQQQAKAVGSNYAYGASRPMNQYTYGACRVAAKPMYQYPATYAMPAYPMGSFGGFSQIVCF